MMKHSLIVKIVFVITTFLHTKYLRSTRNILWRMVGVKVGKHCNIMPGVEFIAGDITVGDGTFIGQGTKVTGGDIYIGENCDIAPWTIIHAGTHEIDNSDRRAGRAQMGRVTIGRGSWIGTGCRIIHPTELGQRCVVGAGTLVVGKFESDFLILGGKGYVKKKLLHTATL